MKIWVLAPSDHFRGPHLRIIEHPKGENQSGQCSKLETSLAPIMMNKNEKFHTYAQVTVTEHRCTQNIT